MCKRAQSDNKENVRILIVSVFHIAPFFFLFGRLFVCLFLYVNASASLIIVKSLVESI